ncbi:hypothetical protein [Sediminibacillus albus]|uniref:Uncharacterized protein n=1 Tax=Sediminibacillus albus TaxID=407036 RepID=A0A1G8ZNQ8_9BACI|nr:hypothetical protein [Sediminibacillus albus]SDK16749.1 hypothetical protein SAMN05216243_2132 [Sediminibacillus albus]
MKKIVPFLLILLVILLTYAFLDRNETVLFGDVMENGQITEILINNESTDKIVKITNVKLIDKIMKESSKMKVKKTDNYPEEIQYSLILKREDYKKTSILLGNNKLDISGSAEEEGIYAIEGRNHLLEIIKNEVLNWMSPVN